MGRQTRILPFQLTSVTAALPKPSGVLQGHQGHGAVLEEGGTEALKSEKTLHMEGLLSRTSRGAAWS